MLSGVRVCTNMNDLHDCDVHKGFVVFLPVFSKLLEGDSSFTGRCVLTYYTSVFTMWICLMMKTVYLVLVNDFSGRGRGHEVCHPRCVLQ